MFEAFTYAPHQYFDKQTTQDELIVYLRPRNYENKLAPRLVCSSTTEREAMLTTEEIDVVFRSCLFNHGDPSSERVFVDSTNSDRYPSFNAKRLKESQETIRKMLQALPGKPGAHGASKGRQFLRGCRQPLDLKQATLPEMYAVRDQVEAIKNLILLGEACGEIRFLLPPNLWHLLPGKIPYFFWK